MCYDRGTREVVTHCKCCNIRKGKNTSNYLLSMLFSVLLLCQPCISCNAVAPGARYQLSTGELYIPDYYVADSDSFSIVFHMHGQPSYVEDYFYPCQVNAVVISIQLGSGSSAYSNFFADTGKFQQLLDEALQNLAFHYPALQPQIGFLCVSAWSAGYGGTRNILQVPAYFEMIDAVVLEDGLHTSYINGNQVNPSQMVEFLAFSQEAVSQNKQFFFSHSQIETYTYASTTETADYLLEQLGLSRVPFSGTNQIGMEYTSKTETGNFAIHGFTGQTAADHVDHIEALWIWMQHIDFGATPNLPAFPLNDPFGSTGRNLPWWQDKFTHPSVIPFSPASPGGDGYVLLVKDPAGGMESTRIGNLSDADYYVQCDIYCHYRPELASNGYERVGIFIRDNGNGGFDHTYAGGGYCYIIAWDSDDGRLWCMRSVNGTLIDFNNEPYYLPETAWRRMRIQAYGDRITFLCDGVEIISVHDATFAQGQCGIGYHEFFTTNDNMEGTRADNFLADVFVPVPTVTPTPYPTTTAVSTPTRTPVRTHTPSPASTQIPESPTPEPVAISVHLEMPSIYFVPGDVCYLNVFIGNEGVTLNRIPFFVILEIHGSYWFWDDWSQEFDFRIIDIPLGLQQFYILNAFFWPDIGNESLDGLIFWAACTNAEFTDIIGGATAIAQWTFGFGPQR